MVGLRILLIKLVCNNWHCLFDPEGLLATSSIHISVLYITEPDISWSVRDCATSGWGHDLSRGSSCRPWQSSSQELSVSHTPPPQPQPHHPKPPPPHPPPPHPNIYVFYSPSIELLICLQGGGWQSSEDIRLFHRPAVFWGLLPFQWQHLNNKMVGTRNPRHRKGGHSSLQP